MGALLGLSRAIDWVNEKIGRWIAWLIVAAVVISATNAVIRKLFDMSSNAWLELQWWLFGMVFLLCAPWTLSSNEHIRIDIVNSLMPSWMKQAVEVIGHLFFLIPVCLVMIYTSYPFFIASAPKTVDLMAALGGFLGSLVSYNPTAIGKAWNTLLSVGEQSTNAGGLPVWIPKGLVLVGFVVLLAQAISELIKRLGIITGHLAETASGGGHHAAAEAEAKRLQEAIEEEARKRQATAT
jgi:TRAP-type mannitol/chloroaromatic compound transport system permease small subunit